MSLPYDKDRIPLARVLRRDMTRQERHLWYDFLSSYPLRFQRQKVILGYIVDFYCHDACLVIELDGSQHYTTEGIAYDTLRSDILTGQHLTILRFSNADIDRKFASVCEAIDFHIKNKQASPPLTLEARP